MVGFVKKIAALVAVVGLAATATLPALAATQGTAGATSNGSFSITITVPSLARISSLNDISLGSWTGSGTGGAFTLQNGAKLLPYTVDYKDTGGTFDAVTAGNTLTGQVTTDNSTASCSVATLLQLRVTIAAAALATATAGNYTGTITVLVTPV